MLLELFISKIDAQLLKASRRKSHQKFKNDKIELTKQKSVNSACEECYQYRFQHTLFLLLLSLHFMCLCVLTFTGMLQFLIKKIQPKCMNPRNASVSQHIAILQCFTVVQLIAISQAYRSLGTDKEQRLGMSRGVKGPKILNQKNLRFGALKELCSNLIQF